MEAFSNHTFAMICAFIIVMLCSASYSAGSKYSETANAKYSKKDIGNFESEASPFRMKKVNLIWTKAKKILAKPKLAELYADLKIHDREEGLLKKLRAGDGDKDGKKEAEVLQKYRYIMNHYGLDDYHLNQDNEIPLTGEETKSVLFEDAKLQSMWRRAERSGFSDEDLKLLKEEFWHHQMKLNEFDFMKRELNTDKVDNDKFENDIEEEDLKVDMTEEERKEKWHSLKKRNKDIQEGLLRLEHMAATFPRKELEFKDFRVQKLWALAKKTNWTKEEIESFKEELKHFEHRLSKQDYYQEQLNLSKDALQHKLKEGDGYPEKLALIQEKTDQVTLKVKKLHSHMKARLEKALKHTEL